MVHARDITTTKPKVPKYKRKQIVFPAHDYRAVVFDLDGVVTNTALLHAKAWKEMFDAFFKQYGKAHHKSIEPFDPKLDYKRYVDGKPRYEGVKSLLASRYIELPWGNEDDPPDRLTICGLGNRKNEIYHKLLHEQGAQVYSTTVDFIHQLRQMGLKTAVVSSSKNCGLVLKLTHLNDLFDEKIGGKDVERLKLKGKPSPETFLQAVKQLGVSPQNAVVFEDAPAGVKAGHDGHFGLVVGIDRINQGDALKKNGADIVVKDVGDLVIEAEE